MITLLKTQGKAYSDRYLEVLQDASSFLLEQPDFSTPSMIKKLTEKFGVTPSDAALLVDLVIVRAGHSIDNFFNGTSNGSQLINTILARVSSALFPPVTSLELFVTDDCSMRCDYCFVGEKKPKSMSLEIARKSVDFLIRESRNKKDLSILFFGGEPMMEYDLLKHISTYAKQQASRFGKKVYFSMTTNGVLMNEEKLKCLRDNGISFLLSIDGDRESHDLRRKFPDGSGTFDSLMKLLPLMKKYKPWLGARMTVCPELVSKINENYRFLVKNGFNQVLISPEEGIEWSQENLDIYVVQMLMVIRSFKELKAEGYQLRMNLVEKLDREYFKGMKNRWGCRAGRQSITIATDGRIYPCSKMLNPEPLRQASLLGDIYHGFTNINLRMKLNGMIPVDRSKCDSCTHADSCMGGCFATNYWETGNMFKPGFKYTCTFSDQTRKMIELYSREFQSAIAASEDDIEFPIGSCDE